MMANRISILFQNHTLKQPLVWKIFSRCCGLICCGRLTYLDHPDIVKYGIRAKLQFDFFSVILNHQSGVTFAFTQILNMSTFKAEIDIMPLEALLDPQGKAVTGSMKNLGLPEIGGVRIGKHITLQIEAKDKKTAEGKVDEACKKLLCNEIMEYYKFALSEVK
jgi:phosphoribosylformylglycinamidine synthase PurS subunit